ncbi:MAG: alpha/beta hydrolase-fold protein [Saprospiraceae bacterium]
MKKYFLHFFVLLVSSGLYAQSTVETHTFYSLALGVEKSYLIYLPDGYGSDTTERYPSIYFLRLHEAEWFNPQFRTDGKTLKNVADDLIADGIIGKMILVAPSTGGNSGGTPATEDLTDFGIVNMLRPDLADDEGIGTGKFEDYFFQDLIPHIDSIYRTIPEWCARGVDGFSLGGYASTLYAIKHPGVFSSVGSYDGTIMWYNLDYPYLPGPFDDYNYYYPPLIPRFALMFDMPYNTSYMLAHSATNLLLAADAVTLDSIREMAFHISAGSTNSNTNKLVNKQFIDSLAAKGIANTFSNYILAPNAIHTWAWADYYARLSLPMHWETFVSSGCEGVVSETNDLDRPSSSIELFQNFPNPVSSVTNIAFEIPERGVINIDIFDAFGKRIKRLLSEEFPAGKHEIQMEVTDIPDGVYYYQLENDAHIQTKKLIVLKNK